MITKFNKLPKHIAFILDGNGRWAIKHHKSRNFGHYVGVNTLKEVVKMVKELNIPFMSIYALSTENMARPVDEVNYLLDLAKKEYHSLVNNNPDFNIRIVGERNNLDNELLSIIDNINNMPFFDERFTLIIAFNYSSQRELLKACQNANSLEDFEKGLYTYPAPPIDLLIRTSGEKRLSNFMLYQSAYAELYFDKIYWPSYNKRHLYKALKNYQKRKRNFGKI